MKRIPAGRLRPFLKTDQASGEQIRAFWLDTFPVTNEGFLEFVQTNPDWRRDRVKAIFADPEYLNHWQQALAFTSPIRPRSPVTNVSWFAANAYCRWRGKRLPTQSEWEYAVQGEPAQESAQRILRWYSKPAAQSLPEIGAPTANRYGVSDLVGVIWEWTRDFNTLLVAKPARSDREETSPSLFCGGASSAVTDPSDYASFMRFSFRASLKANYAVASLGFRCAKEVQ